MAASHQAVDWLNWAPPGEGDVRSPCPAINSLANHGIYPHNGKGITKAMAIDGLVKAFNLDPKIASTFATGALWSSPNRKAGTFDLNNVDKHGLIEHDVSLSREDIAFGSNSKFNKERFSEVLAVLQDASGANPADKVPEVTWKSATEARLMRLMQSKARHQQAGTRFGYNIKDAVMSYGETSLYMNVLGKDGVVPLAWLKTFFEEERLPYREGWRAPPAVTQAMLNTGFKQMLKNSNHKVDEAKLIAVGTVKALGALVVSLFTMLLAKITGRSRS